ncbi:MAG TPA: hypothetical protein K8V47_07085, partial [Candidatus Amulumruptor caecigallinarius]|nr:hypothetical protein [Candidatus Amulumruptor caecigallinarius]
MASSTTAILKRIIGALVIFAFIVRLWLFADMFLLHTPINEWGFTEYLINFSGGFVRRGIIGEGLFAMARIGIPTSI